MKAFLLRGLIVLLLFSAYYSAAQTRLDSVHNYLVGSWKVEVERYFDGDRDGIERDVIYADKLLQVFESNKGIRKLKYKGETRLDSLDDGTIVLYVYLENSTITSNCNTLLFHLHPDTEESMLVAWFELYYLREVEKTNFYFANCRFSRIAD